MRMKTIKYGLMATLVIMSLSLSAQTRIFGDWGSNYRPEKNKINKAGLYTDQYDGVRHLAGLQVDGGYSMFISKSDVMSMRPGGYTAGASLLYTYLNGIFFIQTGVGVRWQDVKNTVSDQFDSKDLQDAAGTNMHMTYDFKNRIDESRMLYLQVPLYVGGYARGFYFMIGPKFYMPLYGSTQLDLTATSIGHYDKYIGDMEEMDNHGMRKDVPLTPDQRNQPALKLKIDVAAVVELGYEFAFSNKGLQGYRKSTMLDQRLRIGAFAEMGILNISPKTDLPLNGVPDSSPYDFQSFQYNHVISTANVSSVHNLFAGIRISYFFFSNLTKEKCLLCGSNGMVTPW